MWEVHKNEAQIAVRRMRAEDTIGNKEEAEEEMQCLHSRGNGNLYGNEEEELEVTGQGWAYAWGNGAKGADLAVRLG